tara:strand:- start:4201 stop:4425 length:225 start_codon:yes stop_codon:yes gene_type:complete
MGIAVYSWRLPDYTNTGDISLIFHELIPTELEVNSCEQLALNTSCVVVRNVCNHTVNNELDVAALANNKLHIIK